MRTVGQSREAEGKSYQQLLHLQLHVRLCRLRETTLCTNVVTFYS